MHTRVRVFGIIKGVVLRQPAVRRGARPLSHSGKKTYGGSIIITNPDLMTVADQRMRNCDIVFFGVLEDVYQRQFITEKIEYHIN